MDTSHNKKVHVVVADCGEYSDWTMWLVAAFETADAAEDYCGAAQVWADAHTREKLDPEPWLRKGSFETPKHPLDEDWEFDWEAPRYSVHVIPQHTADDWVRP